MTVVSLVAVLRLSVGTSHIYIVAVLRDRVERSVLTGINEYVMLCLCLETSRMSADRYVAIAPLKRATERLSN